MATFTLGNATWTNGSHIVLMDASTGTPFPSLFLSSNDTNVTGITAPYINGGAVTGATVSTINDPTAAYSTKGTWAKQTTCTSAGSCTNMLFRGAYSDGYYGNNLVSGGATHLTAVIKTTNNTGNWRLFIRPTAGSDAGASVVDLPATPDGVWTTINLAISHGGEFTELAVKPKPGQTYFNVGDAVSVAAAHIYGDTLPNVPRMDGAVSPDGITNWEFDTIQHIYTSTGPRYMFYLKNAFSGTTGSYSTTFTDITTGQSRDLVGNITGTNTTTGSSSVVRKLIGAMFGQTAMASTLSKTSAPNKLLSSSVDGLSALTSSLTSIPLKLFNGVVGGLNTVTGSMTTTPTANGFAMGNATWTNGSKIVTFANPNAHVVMLNDFYPYTDTTNQRSLTAAGEWGTGAQDIGATSPNDLNAGIVQYRRASTGVANNTSYQLGEGVTDAIAYDNLEVWPDYYSVNGTYSYIPNSQALRIMRSGSSTYLNSTNLNVLTVVTNADTFNSSNPGNINWNDLKVSIQSTTGSVVTTNGVYWSNGTIINKTKAPLETQTDYWYTREFVMPNSIASFKQVSVFYGTDNTYRTPGLLIDSVYLTDTSDQSIHMSDYFSPDGGTTRYPIAKILQNSSGVVTLILRRPYTGTTGSFATTRYPLAPVGNVSITGNSTVGAGGLTRLQVMIAQLANASGLSSALRKIGALTTAINTQTLVTSKASNVKALKTSMQSTSVASSTVKLLKSLKSIVGGSSTVSAIEYIRFKFMTAMAAANGNLYGFVKKKMSSFITTPIAATSTVTSTRTRLVMYTSEAISAAHSVVVTLLSYALTIGDATLNSLSGVVGKIVAARPLNATVESTSDAPAFLLKDVALPTSTIDGQFSAQSALGLTVGIAPTMVGASGRIASPMINRSVWYGAVADALSSVEIGEFFPVNRIEAVINASGSVDAHVVRSVLVNSVLESVSDFSAVLTNTVGMSTSIDGDGVIKARLSVPDVLRQLLVTSSGVVIAGDDNGNVVFTEVVEEQQITIRGLTVVELDDVVNSNKQTIVVLMT